jgi:hypothetical protein
MLVQSLRRPEIRSLSGPDERRRLEDAAVDLSVDHLRPDLKILIEGKKRVINHIAVVTADVRCGPPRIEDLQVRMHHSTKHLFVVGHHGRG